ncbi:MAG: ATP-binding cassette domain-containing protein [Fibrella sp.]|nr:ATP-binding cassette domain-containing protein [Armatimonadota bacterium]
MIEAENLQKHFNDPKTKQVKRAVDGISFATKPGEIFGLLGANGAGKTTTIRMLATILEPTGGKGTVNGYDIQTEGAKVRASIGYLTGTAALYDRLTAREMLRFFGELFGMEPSYREARIETLAETLEMHEFLDRRCDKLSTGQRQRTSIARSVLHEPPVLFFDEPTSGLDIMAARTVVRFIRRSRQEGKTILFSTHIMSEVEALCDRVAVVHDGKIAAIGTLAELRDRTGGTTFEQVFLRLIGEPEN